MEADRPTISHKTIIKVIEEARALQHDARFVSAGNLMKRVDEYLSTVADHDRKEIKTAVGLLHGECEASFDELRRRAAECVSTLSDWHASDWLLAQTFMGITTSYKHDPDGSLWVKMHGTMDNVRVVDQLATMREVDLFRHWIPFCDKSSLLKRLGIVEMLAYFNTAMPGTSRDCVLHAYGCDAVLEENCILIQGQSVESWAGVEFPKVEGWRHGRLDVKAFRAKIEILSPTSASTSIVANIDPKTPLPKAVVNFLVRKVAGMLLYCLQQTARRITTDEDSRHRRRIVDEKEFYARWLYPRIKRFYEEKGWAFDDQIAVDVNTLDPDLRRRRWQNSISEMTPFESRRRCTLKSRKKSRIKRALGRLRRKRQADSDTGKRTAVEEPQVDGLGVDPRLLEKWQARRQLKLQGSEQPATSSTRLLIYLSVAVFAAIGSKLFSTIGKKAYRFRAWLSALCLATFLYCAKGYV